MDRIGDANKTSSHRISDAVSEIGQPEAVTPNISPSDEPNFGVDTSKFLKTKLVIGLEFSPLLRKPLLPGHQAPDFIADAIDSKVETKVALSEFKGTPVLLVFLPNIMTKDAEKTFGMLSDLAMFPDLDIKVLTVSTDKLATQRVWLELTTKAPKMTLISDKEGNVSRNYGVLDNTTHLALTSVFIIDKEGCLQGSRVTRCGRLQPSQASDMRDFIKSALQDYPEQIHTDQGSNEANAASMDSMNSIAPEMTPNKADINIEANPDNNNSEQNGSQSNAITDPRVPNNSLENSSGEKTGGVEVKSKLSLGSLYSRLSFPKIFK